MKIAAILLYAFAAMLPVTSLSTAAQTRSSSRAPAASAAGSAHAQPVEISIAPALDVKYPLTGRVLVCISKEAEGDPCKQIGYDYTSQQIYGQDVTNLAQGQAIALNDSVFGYPIARLADLPAGDYRVQATFNVYEDFHLANGHTVSLPPDRGEGQQWDHKPGNPISAVAKIHLDPASAARVKIVMDQVNPPAPPPDADTKYMKHVSMRSEMLSKFWGRDMYLSAWVLLPPGFDEHPDAHYPELIWQDHFAAHFRAGAGFRDTPPDPKADERTQRRQQTAYNFYLDWTSGRLPKMLIIQPNHANPYFDDSYAVNSANLGPYGDAITQELIPAIEKQYRGIGQGWARVTSGGSTGGWESLAAQIFYPEYFNGTWTFCPDPIDFHGYQTANLYENTNAYFIRGPFESVPIPAVRKGDGDIISEMDQIAHFELALGTHGRSGEQFDIWQAVYSPVGPDGYPAAVFNKLTGDIDKSVVDYWHEHYDLNAILHRDWSKLGPQLEGKIHIAVGDSDTYFLNKAVHLMEDNLKQTRNPHSDAVFDYGPGAPHCFSGTRPDWADDAYVSVTLRILPEMAKHITATAPAGADLKSWKY
jgi:putative esterase